MYVSILLQFYDCCTLPFGYLTHCFAALFGLSMCEFVLLSMNCGFARKAQRGGVEEGMLQLKGKAIKRSICSGH